LPSRMMAAMNPHQNGLRNQESYLKPANGDVSEDLQLPICNLTKLAYNARVLKSVIEN